MIRSGVRDDDAGIARDIFGTEESHRHIPSALGTHARNENVVCSGLAVFAEEIWSCGEHLGCGACRYLAIHTNGFYAAHYEWERAKLFRRCVFQPQTVAKTALQVFFCREKRPNKFR